MFSIKKPIQKSRGNPADHFANERTYLAWIRTGIGIIAFGFVIERFSMFVKEIVFALHDHKVLQAPFAHAKAIQDYSSTFGIILIVFGALMCIFAFINYMRAEKQIEADQYHPSPTLSFFLMLSIVMIGVVLLVFLILEIFNHNS